MAISYTNLRLDLGLADDETVFTDDELDTLWERVSGASNEAVRHSATLGLMARQMMAKAISMHDQSVVASSAKQSQVYDHWKQTYEMYRADLEAALGQSKQFVIGAIRPVKHQTRETPSDAEF